MPRLLITIILSIFICTAALAHANVEEPNARLWLVQNQSFAAKKILQHMSPVDGLPGAIIAAPSHINPDYYYHWVRDAAIAVDALMTLYSSSPDKHLRSTIRTQIAAYVDYSTHIQEAQTQSGLGEPKFHVNGNPYQQPWGRPQNDGPALRAISMIHWANILITEGHKKIVFEKLYAANFPATSPIKKDLEYISHHWKDSSFDLWEEVKGSHFYTLMVIRKALLCGASLAIKLNDNGAASWYQNQAKEIEYELRNFLDSENGVILTTINQTGGLTYKTSNLDIAVILGLLHGDMHDGFLSWDNPKIMATINRLSDTFQKLYPINRVKNLPGIAIGRYPEDKYAGTSFSGGNPWPLCTLAIAEALYRYAQLQKHHGNIHQAQIAIARADSYVDRVRYHAHKNGDLDEQIDRSSGYMTSAPDLTWNYAAMLTAARVVAYSHKN